MKKKREPQEHAIPITVVYKRFGMLEEKERKKALSAEKSKKRRGEEDGYGDLDAPTCETETGAASTNHLIKVVLTEQERKDNVSPEFVARRRLMETYLSYSHQVIDLYVNHAT